MHKTQWAQVTNSKYVMAHAFSTVPSLEGRGRRMDQSDFRPVAEVSFAALVGIANAKKETPDSMEDIWENKPKGPVDMAN